MQYDALGRVIEIELPKDVTNARKKITPTYNKAGGLEKVSFDGTTYVENIAYNAKGQRVVIAFGNGIMTRYAYDKQTFRLKRQKSEKYVKTISGNTITYTPQAGSTKQDDGFDYDLVGNIMKILHRTSDCGIAGTVLGNDALDRAFTYDPLNRLLTASGRESDTQSGNNFLYDEAPIPGSPNANHVRAYNRTYSYDKLGNVQQVKQLGNNGFTRDFTYAANKNTLTKIEDATPALLESYTYDANGNQLSTSLTRSYTWNHADQIVGFTGSNTLAQYDYSGQDRVSKFVKTGNDFERTIYIDGVFEYHILEKPSATYEKNYVHVMDDSSRIAEVRIGQQFPNDISDSVVYNLETEIGSSAVRLDVNGTVIDKEEYYPFGDFSLRTFTYKRYRYVGKERDRESGLYYYGARYYAAWTCRFISVDPLAGKYVWQSSYVHADNNPINKVDHNGEGTSDGDDKGKTQSASNGGGDKAKPTSEVKDPNGYEGKAGDCGRVYHCGTYDSKGNITMAEGYYKVNDYQKNVNKDYVYNYTPSYPDPHKFSTGGKIIAGAYTGMVHGLIGNAKFGKGLLTGESYPLMWGSLKTAGNFINPWSEKGDTLRTQMFNWASNYKKWDIYDWSYGAGMVGTEILLSRGASSTLKLGFQAIKTEMTGVTLGALSYGGKEIATAAGYISRYRGLIGGNNFVDFVMHGEDLNKLTFWQFNKLLTQQGVKGNVRLWICNGGANSRAIQLLANRRNVMIISSPSAITVQRFGFTFSGEGFSLKLPQ